MAIVMTEDVVSYSDNNNDNAMTLAMSEIVMIIIITINRISVVHRCSDLFILVQFLLSEFRYTTISQ